MKKPIAKEPIELNLDEIEGAEDFLYVRAELLGEGGMCLSQALIIDNGRKRLVYSKPEVPNDIKRKIKRAVRYSKLGCK